MEELLRSERERRIKAEHALSDVEKECSEPFVVPALLQAFVSISKMTQSNI